MPSILNIMIGVPIRVMCLSCNTEMMPTTGKGIMRCPQCKVAIRIDIQQGPQSQPQIPDIKSRTAFKQPPPIA